MAFIQVNLLSESLMRTVNVNVVLPTDRLCVPSVPGGEKHYQTLILLHGVFGSQMDWIKGTKLQHWAEEKALAVVMPAGENSFYVDREKTHELYGEFVGRELVEQMRRMFPLSCRREDTFIGGLSMGGYGALRNGLKYNETFGRIIALSTADIVDGIEDRDDSAARFFETKSYAESVFGELSKVKGSDRDIRWLAEALSEKNAVRPEIFMACGVDDPLLAKNRSLRSFLEDRGFVLHYEEGPGGHEWDFWNGAIKRALDWLPLEAIVEIGSGNARQ